MLCNGIMLCNMSALASHVGAGSDLMGYYLIVSTHPQPTLTLRKRRNCSKKALVVQR